MKFRITVKDPDGVSDCIRSAASEQLSKIEGLLEHEREELIESRVETLRDFTHGFIEWDEYITVEFDTDKNTCEVVKKGK